MRRGHAGTNRRGRRRGGGEKRATTDGQHLPTNGGGGGDNPLISPTGGIQHTTLTQSVRSSSGDMVLRLSHVTGHRHWYFYVLALVCVGWWNAAVLVLPRPPPAAAAHDDVVGPRSPSEHRLINLTDFRYAGGGGTARQLQSSMRFVIRHCSCLSVTFVSKLETPPIKSVPRSFSQSVSLYRN